MSGRRGALFVISAPSGSGKTTLVSKLLAAFSDLRFSVSYTTRAPRGAERDGVDYHFVTRDKFQEKIGRGEFLEWAEVHGNLYGTSKPETDRIRAEGDDILLDVDVQGAEQVRMREPEAVTMFVMPPSFGALEKRLRGRKQDSPEVIEGRLAGARKEINRYRDYHYVLVNEDVEETAELLKAIVHAERARPHLLEERLRPIVGSFRS
ncbi:MAG TPA: guanylate kinase [Vicinamibacteria bacterium]|nr:guanylate kinase [Vicinamibacteria bacterium]